MSPSFLAIISDLDDTLLNAEHQMTDRTQRTLQRLVRQGVKVIFASGRSGASMRPAVRKTGTPWPYIAFNGAQIVDAKTDKVLVANEVPYALAKEVLRWFEARNVYTQLYSGDDWFYDTPGWIADAYAKSSGVEGIAVGRLSAYISGPAPKLLAIDTPERVRELLDECSAAFGDTLSVTTSKDTFLEITSPKANKGEAVRALAEMIGLDPETTLVAGDSLNDLSMLRWTKWPVTVENGRDQLKKMAWRVAGDGHQDGIARLLDELIAEVPDNAH